MAKKCNACGRYANSADGIICNTCACLFHRACVNILKEVPPPPGWLCPGCKAKTPRKDNSENPVRGEKSDYGSTCNSPALVDNKSEEILREIKLMRQEVTSFRNEFSSLREQTNSVLTIVEGFSGRIDDFERRLERLENSADKQTDTNISGLLTTIERLKSIINDGEQESLLNDVELTGIPEEPAENVGHLVRTLTDKLGVVCDERDIVFVERAGIRRAPLGGEPPRPRPVVVRLARRQLRDAVLQAARVRRHLTTEGLGLNAPPTRVYINERLSRYNKGLFFKSRVEARARGWKYVWSRAGRVFVRRETGTTSFRVRLEEDLVKIFGAESGHPNGGPTTAAQGLTH